MTASVPSGIALATSDASAPDGPPAAPPHPPHERESQIVGAVLDAVRRVFTILARQRWRGYVQPPEIHPLVSREGPAVRHPALHARRDDPRDLEREEAIVEQDAGARPNVGGEIGVRRRQLIAARDVLRR